MRMPPRGSFVPVAPARVFALVVLMMTFALVGAGCPFLQAQAPPSGDATATPDPTAPSEWTLDSTTGWRSRSLPLGPIFQIRLDGRSFYSSRAAPGNAAPPEGPGGRPSTLIQNMEVKPLTLRREMKLDPKRQGIRVLDTITNTGTENRHVRVEYATSLSEKSGVKFNGMLNQKGDSREYGNGIPDESIAALVFAESPGSQAVPFFVWGQSGAKWTLSLRDVSSSVSFGYEGDLAPGEKAAFVHWIAAAGLNKNIKIERTFDLFWKDGRLVDPMLTPEIIPLVVNFTPEALASPGAGTAAAANPAGRLLALDGVCKKLGVTPDDRDLLWMGKDEQFRGDFTVDKVVIETTAGPVLEFPPMAVAALRGGGGRGRTHHLYLRDGSVLPGRVKLPQAKLTGEIGALTLDADGLELLLLRASSENGKIPPQAKAFVQLQNGAHYWLEGTGVPELEYVTVFGSLKLPFTDVWSLQRKAEPPFNLTATLADGSRIQGVPVQPVLPLQVVGMGSQTLPLAEMARLGAAELMAGEMAFGDEAAPDKQKEKAPVPSRYCFLRDGSFLVGELSDAPVKLRVNGNTLDMKPAEIVRFVPASGTGGEVNVELANGGKLQGEILSEVLEWRIGSRTVLLPPGMVTELVRKGADSVAPPPTPPSTTAGSTGRNDPLAMPPGFTSAQLMEVTPDYPKPMFIGTPVPTGDIPNLEAYNADEARKRLTFQVPRGAINLALRKPVTSSDSLPIIGSLDLITDGNAGGADGSYVELAPGLQWVQVDLGKASRIWKILLWHFHKQATVYFSVIVQVSDDPEFKTGVTTIFNNDHSSAAGQGKGLDPSWVETNRGRLIDGQGAKGRYVRLWSDGNTANEMNHYIEVSVYGTPES